MRKFNVFSLKKIFQHFYFFFLFRQYQRWSYRLFLCSWYSRLLADSSYILFNPLLLGIKFVWMRVSVSEYVRPIFMRFGVVLRKIRRWWLHHYHKFNNKWLLVLFSILILYTTFFFQMCYFFAFALFI